MKGRQEVDERYKVDSTSGGSLINPVNYKGDVMVQVWMDSRVLATICRWMENEGEIPRFLSHVVRIPLEMLADHLVEDGKVEMVDDTLEARILLEGRFHVNLNKGRKGMKNLMHNVTLSGRRGTDLGSRAGGGIDYRRPEEIEPIVKKGQEEVVAEYRKEEARKKKEMDEIKEKEVEKAKAAGIVVDNEISSIPCAVPPENRESELSRLIEIDKRMQEMKKESGGKLSQEEVKAKVQAEMKGEAFIPDSGPVVKEGMNDEEYEVMMKDRGERDAERIKLENAPFSVSDLPTVESEKGEE